MDYNIINLLEKGLHVEYLYSVEGYTTFYVQVKSGVFVGETNFCIPESNLNKIIKELSIMYNALEGGCIIEDNDSDSVLNFHLDKLGLLVVQGQVGGSHEKHYMKFEYYTDQTILKPLIKILSNDKF